MSAQGSLRFGPTGDGPLDQQAAATSNKANTSLKTSPMGHSQRDEPAAGHEAPGLLLGVPSGERQQLQQQQQCSLHQSSSSSNSTTSGSQRAKSPEPKVSFYLKTSIFTRRITMDSDRMALGSIKQLAIGFLNELYFQHSYPPHTAVGDYLKRNFPTTDHLAGLYERIILRKYSPDSDSFQPFNSVADITQDSFISIEISEREPPRGAPGAAASLATGAASTASRAAPANSVASLAATAGQAHPHPHPHQPREPTTPTSQLKISHDFHTESYFMPTHCASCSTLIKGVFKQGFQCASCKKNYCPKCKLRAEATGEGCLTALALLAASPLSSCAADSGLSSSSSSASPNGGQQQQQQQQPGEPAKLEVQPGGGQQHVNMSKRKSASNLLHFNLANPFKIHHGQQQQQEAAAGSHSPAPHKSSSSKSMRGSAGALDPILQQLSKQMREQLPQQQPKTGAAAAGQQQQPRLEEPKLLNVQATQLSSSHQNLFSMAGEGQRAGQPARQAEGSAGSSSAHQSPSKPNVKQQLSNSARDLVHSPTRREQAGSSSHQFVSMDWTQLASGATCGLCSKALAGGAAGLQAPAMCKTCKLQVHAQCQHVAPMDCLARLAESSRAAAAAQAECEQRADDQSAHGAPADEQQRLKGTNSNVSRENIRLHRLAPSVKHVKRPDLTRPIIESWLEHKTLSDEQPRRHYWRLDETDITLYENDTSTRYFKAIALNKITRVISASSLPKQIKEDVALSSGQQQQQQQQSHPDQRQDKSKSAGTSPLKSPELRAQMEAMFAFELATGSVYLVQASDWREASRWRSSLEAITSKRAAGAGAAHATGQGAAAAVVDVAQQEGGGQATPADERHQLAPSSQQVAADEKQQQQQVAEAKKPGRHHHYHHHHNHHQTPTGGAQRNQHKTYTDPNRSRLYNRPRMVIKLDSMSIPDHLIERKYLIERNRSGAPGFEELGSGQFGKVYAAISEIKAEDTSKGLWSGVPVAIKEISKARFDLRQQAKLKNEANILSRLDHPGVIILERVHDLADKLYIVMEQLEDDMLEMIVSTAEKRLSERVTKFLTYQILEALKYLHSQNIAHCDLKPENVLLCERRSQFPQIKLCDFGFAKIIEENSFRSSLVGTPAYLAPEVVKGERYNRSVDLWSVGVIVYVSLSGEFPFNEGENIHDQISRANFMYPEHPWARISQQAKSFINSLLRVNSDRRLSANRAQMDDWIQDYQLWCDLSELELRVGRRWVTDDADYERWSRYARQHQLQVPRSAVQLHQELNGD